MDSVESTICLLDIDYVLQDNKPVVRLWGKTADGRTVVVFYRRFNTYFYAEPLIEGVLKNIKDLEVEGVKPFRVVYADRKLYGQEKRMIKIVVEKPSDIALLRNILREWESVKQCYENGISFYKRFIIDNGLIPAGWVKVSGNELQTDVKADIAIEADEIKPLNKENYPKLRILAFDIEMVEEDGKEDIIMISMADNTGFKRVLSYGGSGGDNTEMLPGEKEMILRFIELVQGQNPDIITGYNTDNFDFPKIRDKCIEYGIPFVLGRAKQSAASKKRGDIAYIDFSGIVNLDLYAFINAVLSSSLNTEVLTLDKVCRELLGKGKKGIKWKDIENAWKDRNTALIADYCLQDSELALDLANHLLPQLFELCKVTGQFLSDVSRMSYSQLVEWLLIRKAFEAEEVVPNRPPYSEIMKRRAAPAYAGGYVHEPKEGVHDNIALFDFTSLYPSIIITHNVSPDVLDCSCCKENGHKVPEQDHYFCTKNKGFVAGVLEEIVNKRLELKRELKTIDRNTNRHKSLFNRQYALKILANASYGYYGYAASRWYSRVCAESITSWGRHYIRGVINLAESLNHFIIYGDTDSLFLEMPTQEEARDFLQKANGSLPGVMQLDFKDIYKTGIFVLTKSGIAAKKRYALLDYNDNIVIKGFERVRRDWAPIAKITQESVLLSVLKDKSAENAINKIQETIQKLKDGVVPLDDLIIYSQITRPLSRYEQIGPHVAAAKKMVERGKIIKEGHTIGYVITKGVGSISQRAEPAEDATNYDPDYYINNQVVPAALRILAVLGYSENDIFSDRKQVSLKGFLEGVDL